MSIWEKLRNWLMDLYYWRTERKLVKEENCELWKMVKHGENMREALNADFAENRKEYEERIDALPPRMPSWPRPWRKWAKPCVSSTTSMPACWRTGARSIRSGP